MDLATIEMSKEEAKERLSHYEKLMAEERSAEDEAIAQAYRAAARGLPVIQLSKCIAAGGFFDNGLPRLAVLRATSTECFVRNRSNEIIYSDKSWADNRGALVGVHTVRVPMVGASGWQSGSTIVPMVPPQYRPKRSRLRNFHVLWEVEKWTKVAPVDPALIRHIRGDLWAVVATWDLTEIERAVLSARG